MSQAGDYGEARSEPWTYRKRIVPLKTWSGRVVHDRRTHFFTIDDAARILAKIQPPAETPRNPKWLSIALASLRNATLGMLERMLWFMDSTMVESLYEFAIGLLDKMFGVEQSTTLAEMNARRIITQVADRAGLTVTIKKV